MTTAMQTSMNGTASTLAPLRVLGEDTQAETISEYQQLAKRNAMRQVAANRIRSLLASAPIMNERDATTFVQSIEDSALERDLHANTHEAKIQYIQNSVQQSVPKQVETAKTLAAEWQRKIDEAVRNQWISQQSGNRWLNRMYDNSVLWYQKYSFLTNEKAGMKKYINDAKVVAEERKILLKDPRMSKLSSSKVPRLALFKNNDPKGFLELHYTERKQLLTQVSAALDEVEMDSGPLFAKAKNLLQSAAHSGAMHENRILPWLESLFEKKRSNEEISRILQSTLPNYIRKWNHVRLQYDIADKKLEENRVPENVFARLSPEAFLQKELPEREAYVLKAKQAVLDYRRERDGAFFDLQLLIDQEDFEEAKKEADRLGNTPLSAKETWKLEQAKFDIRMGQIDDARQSQTIEKKQGDEAPLQDARAAYDELHNLNPAAARMAHMAAGMSVGAVNSFKNGVYNVVWCMQRKIPIFNDFVAAEEAAREQSAERAEHNLSHGQGHTLTYKGSKDEMDRFEDGKWKSDVVFVSQDTEDQKDVIQTCEEQKNNHAANYWRSIVVPNLDRDQYPAVLSALYKLRGAMNRAGGKPMNLLDIKASHTESSAS